MSRSTWRFSFSALTIYRNKSTVRLGWWRHQTLFIVCWNLCKYFLLFVYNMYGFNIWPVSGKLPRRNRKHCPYLAKYHTTFLSRMDICHVDITNAPESISFRWIIIAMIYIATIILTLCAETMDEKLYLTNYNITVFEEEMVIKISQHVSFVSKREITF